MSRNRKMLSVLAASALLVTGAFAGTATPYLTPVANAQPAETIAPVGEIPREANLHVHKRLGVPAETPNNGTEQAVPGDPAPGIDFYAHRVTSVDLTTLDGWQDAADLEVDNFFEEQGLNSFNTLDLDGLPDGVTVGEPRTETTDGDGTAVFDGLDTGLYLVVEEPNPTVGARAVAPAAPFLVAVPLTDPDNRDGWLPTVNVYPKGQAAEEPENVVSDPATTTPEGGVDLTGASLGEEIRYRVEGTVPDLGGAAPYYGFVIADKLPPALGEPTISEVTLTGGTSPGTLVDGTDYTRYIYQGGGQWVLVIELSPDRLEGLSGNEAVAVTFDAPVATAPQATQDNQAWVLPSALSGNPEQAGWDPAGAGESSITGTASNITRSVYGNITIDNVDENGNQLAGAVFELRRCDAVGDVASEPIRFGDGNTTVTTNAEGPVTFSGAHLGNVNPVDGADTYQNIWEGNGTQFCLLATTAPENYELAPEPFMVSFDEDPGVSTNDVLQASERIENVRANAGFQLPLTGGVGIWLILGAGALLLIIAAIYYAVTRKRSDD